MWLISGVQFAELPFQYQGIKEVSSYKNALNKIPYLDCIDLFSRNINISKEYTIVVLHLVYMMSSHGAL